MYGWCSRANQSERLIGSESHYDDVTSMKCWLFCGRGTLFVEDPRGGGAEAGALKAYIEVTSLVSDGIERWRIQIQPGSKNFFFLFSQHIFFSRPVDRGKNWMWVVVVFHSTFVDMRTSVERRKKDGELRRCPQFFFHSVTCFFFV